MKRLIIVFFIVVSLFSVSAVSASAAGFSDAAQSIIKFAITPDVCGDNEDQALYLESIWKRKASFSPSGSVELSYDALSSFCADLNTNGFPCSLEYMTIGRFTGYCIVGRGYLTCIEWTYSIQDKVFSDGYGRVFCSEYNTDTLLSTISGKVTTISDDLSTLLSKTTTIQSDLTDVVNYLSGCTQSLANLSGYINGDFKTYFLDVWNDVSSSNTFLGQINTKLSTIVDNMSGGSATNLTPIISRLDSLLEKFSVSAETPDNVLWYTPGAYSTTAVSDVGYDTLSSLCSSVIFDCSSVQVFDGTNFFTLESIDSFRLTETTIDGHTGYFIVASGSFYRVVDAAKDYHSSLLYLGAGGGAGTLFCASSSSTSSVSLPTDAFYTNFGTVGALMQSYANGTLDPTTTFPSLNGVIVGLLGMSQQLTQLGKKIDAIDPNPKVEVVVKEAEYTVNHFTDVVVDSTSDVYNVFYLTDDDGNETPVSRVAVDSLSASGKLLQFLFRLCVDGSLSGIDGSIDSLNDFYFDTADSTLGEGVSIWD